jgi:hypothetical protein
MQLWSILCFLVARKQSQFVPYGTKPKLFSPQIYSGGSSFFEDEFEKTTPIFRRGKLA